MNAKAEDVQTDYFVDGMPNEEYHHHEKGVSSSTIKDADPATIAWGRAVKKDRSKLKAMDFGTDFHLYFLEADSFSLLYDVLPIFNRRKADEKQQELDMIDEWRAKGIVPVTNEDFEKCKAMRESAMGNPTIAAIMAMDGIAERSYFWTDPETGVQCKCRPDWLVLDINDTNRPPFMRKDQTTLVFDLKTIAQMDKVQSQIENLKYYVQDAFYTRGIEQVTGTNVCFVFGFVSTSLALGRHPVKVIMLDEVARFDGNEEVEKGLAEYAKLEASKNDSIWQSVITMDRPTWASRNEDIL